MAQNKQSAAALAAAQRLAEFQQKQAEFEKKQARRRRNTIIITVSAVVVLALALSSQFIVNALAPAPTSSPGPTSLEEALKIVPDKSVAANKTWDGTIEIGDVTLGVELDGKNAPQAVASTLNLTYQKFYNETQCHRLTTAGIYVLQCGDPSGDGTGGAQYSYGPIENAPVDNMYPAGTIAMARRSGDGSSMSSQFFIVYKDSLIPADVAGGYTVLGHVTSGLDQLIAQSIAPGTADGSTDGAPAVEVILHKFLIG